METYWATVAAVVPVLALAVIVELRFVGQRWYEQPRWARVIQGLLWVGFMISCWIVEVCVMRVLAGLYQPQGWLVSSSLFVISFGMSLLLIAPAIEIAFRVATPVISALVVNHLGRRIRWLIVERRNRRMLERSIRLDAERSRIIESSRQGLEICESESIELRDTIRRLVRDLEAVEPNTEVWQKLDRELTEARSRLVQFVHWEQELRAAVAALPPSQTSEIQRLQKLINETTDDLSADAQIMKRMIQSHIESSDFGFNPVLARRAGLESAKKRRVGLRHPRGALLRQNLVRGGRSRGRYRSRRR
ncbi:hypothetical protein ACQCX5_08210 [Propionibacteriaceae bacterium G57]|uniref:hypothetical protein n=1 Tax=Aestuariimicrobium sp. G57 TaxID=3418485 RepID=UPI003DA6FEB1